MENGKEKGEIGEFCIFCRHWAGFDKKEQVIAGGISIHAPMKGATNVIYKK